MAEHNRLFADGPLDAEIDDLIASGEQTPSIAYVGPTVANGRMDAVLLSEGLRGYARLVNRVAELYLGELFEGFRIEVEGEPHAGSVEVAFRFFHPLAESIRQLGDNKLLVGLTVIATLTGLSLKDLGKSLLALFKRLRGRPIDDATDLSNVIPRDLPLSIVDLIRIFNDPEVQAAIRAALRPIREAGIEQFETRRGRRTLESVTKTELLSADAAELEALSTEEEMTLDIEKVALLSRLAWHVSDGGKPFDAKIVDPTFWKRVEEGDRFGYGDRLRVSLQTEAERDESGRLRLTRTITKVHWIERRTGEQINLL